MVRIIKKITKTIPGAIADLTSEQLDNLTDFAKHPKRFVRGIFLGWVLSGVAAVLTPIFEAIQLVLLGTHPAQFAATGETWGLVDLPVAIAEIAGGALGTLIRLVYGAVAAVIRAAIPQVPGPFEGVIATLVFVTIAVAAVRIGLPLLRAALEAVPFVGGPLSTLLGKL